MTQTLDPFEFRSGQREQWNIAATGWRKWSELIDKGAGKVSERLVELAGIEPGHRVLDVACGYGEPALTAAKRVGPEGAVVATDISAQMLAYGRERAAAAGVHNIEFVESDAASLESPEVFTSYIREIAPPLTAMLASHPPDVQEETWAAITEAVREAAGSGDVRLSNQALLASGRA